MWTPQPFALGDTPIAWYGIIIAVGFMLAFLYAMFSCKDEHQQRQVGQLCVGRHGHRHHRGTALLCTFLSWRSVYSRPDADF